LIVAAVEAVVITVVIVDGGAVGATFKFVICSTILGSADDGTVDIGWNEGAVYAEGCGVGLANNKRS
jgi:hypothetical protein